jgi:hypothetical protein
MCFYTTKTARAKIAKTDIECWKRLQPNKTPLFYRHLPPYLKNKKSPKIKIHKHFDAVEQGYHSFQTQHIAVQFTYCFGESCVHKFIIPAGTRYYENETEYVSETIILVE